MSPSLTSRLLYAGCLCVVALFGSSAGSPAADAGTSVIRAAYAVYFSHGFTKQDVAAYKPYFQPDLYALAVFWSKIPPLPGKSGYACTFDSDVFSNAQNGTPVAPVKIGAPTKTGGATLYPVAITLKFTKGTLQSHVVITVVQQNGRSLISDLTPVIDGIRYPGSSLRANLTAFKGRPACR